MIEHEQEQAYEELDRRLAATEASQRSMAMSGSRTQQETDALAQRLDIGLGLLGNKMDSLHGHLTITCASLNTNVLEPLDKVKAAIDFQWGDLQCVKELVSAHDKRLGEILMHAEEITAMVRAQGRAQAMMVGEQADARAA